MASVVAGGLGLAALGIIGRQIMKASAGIKYYKGGFEAVMTKREASLILGISPSSSADRIKQAHKQLMILNHPDKGGSPYVATKVNSAKDLLMSDKP